MHRLLFLVAAAVLTPVIASAQQNAAVVTANAPIYADAKVSDSPLRVAAPGTVLKVIKRSDEWFQVEFNDPELGRRVGWVQRSFLKADATDLRPMDLSVTDAPTATATPAVPTTPAPRPLRPGQRLTVKVIDRQDNEGSYTYVVPGHSSSQANTSVNCSGATNTVNCSGSTYVTGSSRPAMVGSYAVRGATLSLELPDGRVAVVNCESKVNWTEWKANMYRSCRVPLTAELQAEFNGANAKLVWSVSIDGTKTQSETYKILAVLDGR
jgi:hypothetical protein